MTQYNSSLALNVINLWKHKSVSFLLLLLLFAFSVDILTSESVLTLYKYNTHAFKSKFTL